MFIVGNGEGIKRLTLAYFKTVAASLRGIGLTCATAAYIRALKFAPRVGSPEVTVTSVRSVAISATDSAVGRQVAK